MRQQAGGTHVGFFFFSFFSVIFAASAFVSPFFFLHPWVFLAEMCRDSFLPCSLLDAWERERKSESAFAPFFAAVGLSPPPFMKVSLSFTAKNRFEGRKRKATIGESETSSSFSSSSRKMNERQKKSFLFRFFSPFFLSSQRTLFSKGMSLRIHFSRRSGCSHRPPSLLNRIPTIPGR